MNINELETALTKRKKKLTVGVVGSRTRSSRQDFKILQKSILEVLKFAEKKNVDVQFVSGGCYTGADAFIEEICKSLSLKLVIHYPKDQDFTQDTPYYERVQAFYDRNRLIAEDANIVLAMVSSDRTGGTEQVLKCVESINKAKNTNKQIIIL